MTERNQLKLNIKRLDSSIQKMASSFTCGNLAIDNFLKSPEALDEGVGTTYVLLSDNDDEIVGYYNFTTGSMDISDYDNRFKIGGALHLNEFAVAEDYQGSMVDEKKKISDLLFEDFMSRIYDIRGSVVGFSYITLRSTDRGFSLYTRNDFDVVEDDMVFSPTEGKDSDGGTMMYYPIGLEDFRC